MQVDITIDAEQVNAAVTKAIIDSTLGQESQISITAAIKQTLAGTWNNPSVVQRLVERHISEEVTRQLIAPELRDRLHTLVQEYLQTKLTDEALRESVRSVYDRVFTDRSS